MFNQCDLETEHKSCKTFILYPSRFECDALNGIARMDGKTQIDSFEILNSHLGLWHGKERDDKERCLINDDLIDLINSCTLCLFISFYFLHCVVIPFVFSCVFVVLIMWSILILVIYALANIEVKKRIRFVITVTSQ